MPVIVDAHVHLYPPEINRDPAGWAAAAGERHWATLCTRRRKDGRAVQDFPTVDELLRAMDDAGVARAVLLGWYWERAESCVRQNRFYADCVRAHPDRLRAFATVHPGKAGDRAAGDGIAGNDSGAALAEMRRARDDGLVGLGELSPQSQGVALDASGITALLAQAAEWRWPVNLHVTDPESRRFPGRVETPLDDVLALVRAWPRVNFILAHWGGLLPLARPEAATLDNVFYDTAASPLIYGSRPELARRMIDAVGAERVLWGTDFPLVLYPARETSAAMKGFLDELRGPAAGLTASESAALLGENAARLLDRV